MWIENAYERRAALSDNELERLLAGLKEELERYRYAIRNYPPERMERYGRPFLSKLEAKVADVERLVTVRGVAGAE